MTARSGRALPHAGSINGQVQRAVFVAFPKAPEYPSAASVNDWRLARANFSIHRPGYR